MGLEELIARLGEHVAKQLPAPGVRGDIQADVGHRRHHPLHQGRGVDKPQDAVGQHQGAFQFTPAGGRGAHRHITQALPGDGQVLGERGGQQGVGIGRKDAGDHGAVIDQVPVGLIGHQVDRPAVAPRMVHQEPPQLLQGGGVVNLARGVVGGIDDDRPGPGAQGRGQPVQVRQEVLVGFHHLGHAAVVVGIKQVFGEIGGQDHHFIPRVQQGLEDDVEPAGGPAGDDDVLGLELQVVDAAQHPGQGLAGVCKSPALGM